MKRIVASLAFALIGMNGLAGEGRDELGLREFLLDNGFRTYAKTNEICYISFGQQPGTNASERTCIDPPDEFLKRFADRHFDVRKASQYPQKRADLTSLDRNPKTGSPDGIYTVEIVEWLNDTTAKVKYSMYRAPLWAAGYEAVAEKKDGKWQIKQHGMRLVS